MDDLQIHLASDLSSFVAGLTEPAADLWLASAYASLGGLQAFAPAIARARRCQATLGVAPATDPAAVRALQRSGVDLRLVQGAEGSIFHPKCYLSRCDDGRVRAAVGSANLTEGGLGRNAELLLVLAGPEDHPLLSELIGYQQEHHAGGAPVTPELLRHLEAIHAAHAQVAAALDLPPPAAPSQQLGAWFWRECFRRYVAENPLSASYKLVILDLLLATEHGQLPLPELTHRFAAFYRLLAQAGLPPERWTGPKPPLLAGAAAMREPQVRQVLLAEPRRALGHPGIVLFEPGEAPTLARIGRRYWLALSAEDVAEARGKLRARLRRYYAERVGVRADVVPALEAAASAALHALPPLPE